MTMTAKGKGGTASIERLSGLQSAKDRRQALEVAARAFGSVGIPAWEDYLNRGVWRKPLFDPEHTRIVVADGRVVSAVVMGPRMLRFGPVTVPAMTLGPVGTDNRYRKRGYAAAAMEDVARYMKENGYLLAYLKGITGFYHRFGYFPYMAQATATFQRERARAEALPGRLRRMTRKDLPAVRKIFDGATAGRICAADRDERVWDWLIGPGRKTWIFSRPRVIVDGRGRCCGYVTGEPRDPLRISEFVAAPNEAACRVALGALVRVTKRREIQEITLPLPWDDAMGLFLRQYVGAEFNLRTAVNAHDMLMIADFPSLMRRLEPLFTERWKAGRCPVRSAKFVLESEIGAVGFAIGRGRVRVGEPVLSPRVRVPRRWLSGFITGYYSVRDIAARKGARVAPDLVPLVDILFPAGWPYSYRGDNH